jgi:hypothetical protein
MNNSFIEVYDNILSPEDANAIENALIFNEFPWYTQLKTVYSSEPEERSREATWMSHGFVDNSVITSPNMMHLPGKLLESFLAHTGHKYNEIIRITANKTHPTFRTDIRPTPAHQDQPRDHAVLIYYAMDSDGDTVIYNNKEERKIIKSVSPCKNRFLFFSGNYWHAFYLPREHDIRIVVNFNLAIPTA